MLLKLGFVSFHQPIPHKGWVAVKEHQLTVSCVSHMREGACTRLRPSMALGGMLTGPAMSSTVALICSTLLKPFLQESRRACHSVKPGQGGKVTTLPPSACAGGCGVVGWGYKNSAAALLSASSRTP